ncbi:MAG TPA: metalloregulator ArsR/SmtB family transcription factor [Mesorhizobium sp.]|nr:metalloregulator ArsR/SmtB family transcription factor [Mesorhizobium sp.]
MSENPLAEFVDVLKAAAETSRLRILALLAGGDLTVSDLTEILTQSQPRVSRHLKLLLEAGLIERYQEGSWAFFRLSDAERDFVAGLIQRIAPNDASLARDRERLAAVKSRRQARAADYFRRNAASWDAIRSLHAPDAAVEAALLDTVSDAPIQAMLDLGTGTGRMLELFAPIYRRGVGIDLLREMLAVARVNLEKAGVAHVQVRQGDLFSAPVERNGFDLVTMHQVLHYLDEPGRAVREAARFLRPGGRLAIVDFAPHALDFLRQEHAHVRLGFSDKQMAEWFAEAELSLADNRAVAAAPGQEAQLTVKIWVGRDRRQLLADRLRESARQGELA